MKHLRRFIHTAVGMSIVLIAAGMSSCGRESATVGVEPAPAPAGETTPRNEAPKDAGTGNMTTAPQTSTRPPERSVLVADPAGHLMTKILGGQYLNAGDQEKSLLLSDEVQRCRVAGAELLSADWGFMESDVTALIKSYESRHTWINPFDSCRQRLNLWISSGPRMKRENLIRLENCNRLKAIEAVSDLTERNSAAELLMVENLTVLCRLPMEQLTGPVQEAASGGFMESWSRRSQVP